MKPLLHFLGSFLFLCFIFAGLAELFLMAFGLAWNGLSIAGKMGQDKGVRNRRGSLTPPSLL